MLEIEVENGFCRVEHSRVNAQVETDLTPTRGGRGLSFSPTDLMAAAVGSCMASTLEYEARLEGIDLSGMAVSVKPELCDMRESVQGLAVTVKLKKDVGIGRYDQLRNIALKSPVARSLAPNIKLELNFAQDYSLMSRC